MIVWFCAVSWVIALIFAAAVSVLLGFYDTAETIFEIGMFVFGIGSLGLALLYISPRVVQLCFDHVTHRPL